MTYLWSGEEMDKTGPEYGSAKQRVEELGPQKCVLCKDVYAIDTIGEQLGLWEEHWEANHELPFALEGDSYVGPWENGDEFVAADDARVGWICQGCVEAFEDHANKLVVVMADGQGKCTFLYGSQVLQLSDDQEAEIPQNVWDTIRCIVAGTHWHHTDAWRGYERTPDKVNGWTNALTGWHSSLETSKLADTFDSLARSEIVLPYPVIFVIGRTSNVCSIGLDVYVEDENVDAIHDFFSDKAAAPSYAGVWPRD